MFHLDGQVFQGSLCGMSMPAVFCVAPGAPFLDALVDAFLDGRLIPGFSRARDPLALAGATIYVPTRRAARALADTFVQKLAGDAVLLPNILPLGHLDAMETAQIFDADTFGDPLGHDLPPAIGEIERRMILTRLILQWGSSVRSAIRSVDARGERVLVPDEALLVATAPPDAWRLSGDLAGLIDELIIEDVDWAAFDTLGVERFDDYWRITLDFLTVAIKAWPEVLKEKGLVEGARRRQTLIEREIARLRSPTRGPVIAAGSSGTVKATAHLLAAIAHAPMGAVVLAGLDQHLDDAAWGMVGQDGAAGHPQAALGRLLPRLGVARRDVVAIGRAAPALARRHRFLSEALRPAESTFLWAGTAARTTPADIAGVVLIEAPDERQEALALAIVMREALETPGRTAALITPDRTLARRVAAELDRWGIRVEDSGGEPLTRTACGALALLAIACVAQDCAPRAILPLLAHPLAAFGEDRTARDPLIADLETGVFRGPVAQTGLSDIPGLLAGARAMARDRHAHPSKKRISDDQWVAIEALLVDLQRALRPLLALPKSAPLEHWLAAHETVFANLLDAGDGADAATGSDREAIEDLFASLRQSARLMPSMTASGYAAFLDPLFAGAFIPNARGGHPRLKILGLLEARLLSPDIALLGSLDETIWPPAARTDAFLNRPMRATLGLAPPERRIGQTAHDFAEAMLAPTVVLSRAAKRGGTPTVASRFLQRMAAFAGPKVWTECRQRGVAYLDMARAIDRPATDIVIKPPKPRPPLRLRPERLSVTRIETLRRDPYAIHAESILKLIPLEAVDPPLTARDFGTALHGVIEDFTRAFSSDFLPPDADRRLRALARQRFAEALKDPRFTAFQWPRILRNIDFFLDWEGARRSTIVDIMVEAKGAWRIELPSGGPFLLTANADRIERHRDGRVVIVDYKTGAPPGASEVRVGFAPQLTIEAAMVRASAFPPIPGAGPISAEYVQLGSNRAGGARTPLHWDDEPFEVVVSRHAQQLIQLLDSFRQETTALVSRPYPKFASRFAVYDHLARVQEWSAAAGGEAEG